MRNAIPTNVHYTGICCYTLGSERLPIPDQLNHLFDAYTEWKRSLGSRFLCAVLVLHRHLLRLKLPYLISVTCIVARSISSRFLRLEPVASIEADGELPSS